MDIGMNKKTGLTIIAGLIVVFVSMYLSLSTSFLILLIGALVIPPVLVFSLILIEGTPVIIKESQNLLVSGKRFLVISTSRESIILEPQSR